MNELSLGIWLRRERERRGVTLRQIAEQTKVAVPLLEGLEADDLSKWPAGIYRRAFVKSYATAVGLDADEVVRRFDREHPPEPDEGPFAAPATPAPAQAGPVAAGIPPDTRPRRRLDRRARLLGTAADLTVAIVLGLGSAAAGSRLLWPVLLIALYYSLGVLLTGTSPMVALLSDGESEDASPKDATKAGDTPPADAARAQRTAPAERRPSRRVSRTQRSTKGQRARIQ